MLFWIIDKLTDKLFPEIPDGREMAETTERHIRETEEMMREHARRNSEFANAIRERYGKIFESDMEW